MVYCRPVIVLDLMLLPQWRQCASAFFCRAFESGILPRLCVGGLCSQLVPGIEFALTAPQCCAAGAEQGAGDKPVVKALKKGEETVVKIYVIKVLIMV